MLTNTQISSYLIPKEIWEAGRTGYTQISPLSIPARDALEIERRRNKNINLRYEDHRYTIACERIQSLAVETFQNDKDLPRPVIWPTHFGVGKKHSTALAYLITIESLFRALFKSIDKLPYQRFLAVFFPPDDKDNHLKLFQVLVNNIHIDDMMLRASNLSRRMGTDFEITPEQCKLALLDRFDLLNTIQSQNCGLVDVIQIV